ncbi:hypothetical protein [Aminobacter phage Erebus]|nr:hypothetical protein [Aminobacter phage Erebus]
MDPKVLVTIGAMGAMQLYGLGTRTMTNQLEEGEVDTWPPYPPLLIYEDESWIPKPHHLRPWRQPRGPRTFKAIKPRKNKQQRKARAINRRK